MSDSANTSHDDGSGNGEISGTGHLDVVPAHKLKQAANMLSGPPQLLSHKFENSIWHDVKSVDVTGDQLKAPRVRVAPVQNTKSFSKLKDEDEQLIHHSLKGRQKTQHRKDLENWGDCQFVSLCYQELGDGYQRANFNRILKLLDSALQMNLVHNSLTDLSSSSFPRCEELNLNENYIPSFKKLPKIPQIVTLLLADNCISSFDGLGRLSSSPVKHLVLLRNPISYTIGYRQKIFQVLPRLDVLDNIPKLVSDSEPPDYDEPHRCAIS